jgi:hypothetical protein
MVLRGLATPVTVAVLVIVIAVGAIGGYVPISGGGEGAEEGGEGGEGPGPQENLPSAHYLNVSHVGGGNGGLCYLGCTTMLAKYYDASIEFSDVVAYTGSATGFAAGEEEDGDGVGPDDDEEEEEDEEQNLPTSYSIVPQTTKNLGYIPHIAYAGYPKGFFMSFRQEVGSSNLTELSSKSELFDRLKELIASDKPVLTWLDNSSWWDLYFDMQLNVEPLVVTGYSENNVYVHVATSTGDPAKENQPIPTEDFLSGWTETATTPFILYLTEGGDEKTDTEILTELKTHAENASTNLGTCADGLDNGSIDLGEPGNTQSLSFSFRQYGTLRDNVAVFLSEHGYEDVAAKYENSTSRFRYAYEISDHPETTPSDVADSSRLGKPSL